jgi:hypothetical protein
MQKMIEIELSHYKMLVAELEILYAVAQTIIDYEDFTLDPTATLAFIAKLVFLELPTPNPPLAI